VPGREAFLTNICLIVDTTIFMGMYTKQQSLSRKGVFLKLHKVFAAIQVIIEIDLTYLAIIS
jgi:hypothetical protein